jgi:hypothetical protein
VQREQSAPDLTRGSVFTEAARGMQANRPTQSQSAPFCRQPGVGGELPSANHRVMSNLDGFAEYARQIGAILVGKVRGRTEAVGIRAIFITGP